MGYLLPARDGPGTLPDGKSSWDVAAGAAAAHPDMNIYIYIYIYNYYMLRDHMLTISIVHAQLHFEQECVTFQFPARPVSSAGRHRKLVPVPRALGRAGMGLCAATATEAARSSALPCISA